MVDLFHSFRVPHPAFLESYGTRTNKKVNGIQIPVREIHIVTDISIQFPCDRSIAESGKITHKMGVCMGSEKEPTK